MVNSRLSDTVRALKEKIQTMSSIPIEQQRIIFRGRILENESTLMECRLEDQDTVFLVKQAVKHRVRVNCSHILQVNLLNHHRLNHSL